MMLGRRSIGHSASARALMLVAIMLAAVLSPMQAPEWDDLTEPFHPSSTSTEPWNGTDQPWGQFGRTPDHDFALPSHASDGGPGDGTVVNVTELASITSPIVNWQGFETGEGADSYGSIVGNFSGSIAATSAAAERCGEGKLQPVIVTSEVGDAGRQSALNILSGDDAKLAWKVDLGTTQAIRSTPMIHDIDQDGHPEIIVVYDTDSNFNIDVWSPRLTCTESNWQVSGHSNELVWSYSDSDIRIGSPSPHFASSNSGHDAVTQPVMADLELDGSPELVVAVVDDPANDPTPKVMAFEITTSTPTEAIWDVTLDRGTHPSDPTWVQLDGSTTAVVLTTVDSNSGNMWIWKIDGDSGSLDWDRLAVQGTDSDSDAPRLRLPGPVMAQLDTDQAPEMIITVPTDANNRDSGSGARFIGMELTSTTEVFNFRAQNGYADTPPLPVDTTGDGVDDRLCWVTWYSESAFNFNRKGMLGCTDISDENPTTEFTRDLQRGAGNDNDEIAVSPPISMDIDGEGSPDVVVAFGRRVFAFDGDTGASADLTDDWATPLAMPHRVWTAPAFADVDGDGHIDMLYGDVLVSNAGADFAPALDDRGLSFNPVQADPGQTVTVTGQLINIGTVEADDDLDAVLMMNGEEIARERFTDTEPISPSGEGGPLTFSVDITAALGVHVFELVVDVNSNITEMREDNNRLAAEFRVVEPYLGQLSGPEDTTRVVPGTSEIISISLESTGSRTGLWTLSTDAQHLPSSWSFGPQSGASNTFTLVPRTPQVANFEVNIPSDALGDEAGIVTLLLSLNDDPSVNTSLQVPIEVFRTRGLDVVGPEGINASHGQGRPGTDAQAWFMVENLGNAEEQTTSISWTAPAWGGTPSIKNAAGETQFSITLAPGARMELAAVLPVPTSAAVGSNSISTMTMCMGSGEDALCEELTVTFQSVAVSGTPTHHRTLPGTNVTYTIGATLPLSGSLSINLAEAGMVQPDWAWTVTGDWTIVGSELQANGVANETAIGELTLRLNDDAVPLRHAFVANDDASTQHQLNLTLHVLQVYRANMSLISPMPTTEGVPITLNVSEDHRFLMFLENPGNGEDQFEFSASVVQTSGTDAPNVTFTYFDPIKTLGAKATSIGSLDVNLPADTPALMPFDVRFQWTSLGGTNVAFTQDVQLQASPRYEWSVLPGNQTPSMMVPGETLSLNMNITNLGNAATSLTLDPSMTLTRMGNDSSVWTISAGTTAVLGVNESTEFSLDVTVPADAWAQTAVDIEFRHLSGGFSLTSTNLSFEVEETVGWALDLTQTSLEIDPLGENITVGLVHLGNGVEQPYFTKAGPGWNMTLPSNTSPLGPFATGEITVFVQPPSDALAGEIGTMHLRVTGDDLRGMIEEQIPLRVGQSPRIEVDHRGTWMVTSEGGFPTAWVQNLGNDMAILQVDVNGLPDGWSVNQGIQMVLAPGEMEGLPLDLTPASSWNGQRLLLTINVNHPTLGLVSHDIEVEPGIVAFASSPVRDAYAGTVHNVDLYHPNTTITSISGTGFNVLQLDSGLQFTQPITTGELGLSAATNAGDQAMTIYVQSRSYPDASASCRFNTGAFDELGRVALDGSVASCTLGAGEGQDLMAYISMTTSTGVAVPLNSDAVRVASNTSSTLNVSVNNWQPSAGAMVITLLLHDQFGRVLDQEEVTAVSRASNWNIGVNSISSNGDITVGIQRTGYDILADTVCVLDVVASGGWTTRYIVDVAYSEFAPVVSIPEPSNVERDERITASISCDSPFDVDDNPDDDSASTYHKPTSALAVSSSDAAFIIGTAGLLLVLAWAAGVVRMPNNASSSTSPVKGKASEETEHRVEQVKKTSAKPVDEDDISIVVETEEEPHTDIEVVESNDEHVSMVEDIEDLTVVESVPEENRSASGRLASLRQELGEDENDPEPKEKLEDRMDRFFGGGP